jgi:hypothetical protein
MSPFDPASIPSGAISVLGPFAVAYNTAGITTTGVVLYTFRARTLVLGAWAFASTPWTGANPITFEVTAGPDAAVTPNNIPLWGTADMATGEAAATYTKWPPNITSYVSIVSAAGVLGADAFGVAGMTAGVAQVYALVAAL